MQISLWRDAAQFARESVSNVGFDMYNRSPVEMPSSDRVVCHEENKKSGPDHTTPIHLTWRWTWGSGEELEYPAYSEETQRNNIDGVASSA